MHIYEQIRKEINVIDGGTFQTLAERCCFRKFGFKSANYFGTKAGSVKTVKGHPDSFYETNDGGWAFLEAGHVLDKSQALKKVQDDVYECLDYERQHPEIGTLDLIICCYSCSRFTPEDVNSVKRIDPRIRLVGPDDIAEMCTDYPWFAREYLKIETLPTQICDLNTFVSFIERDVFAPSLELELTGRDQEIEELLQALNDNQVICLTGKSGSGKTKLAIEVCARYSALQEHEALVVRPSRKSICEALVQCCSGDKTYLVLLDDANDLIDLKSIREYVSVCDNVKLVVTVRNYVRQSVVEELRHIQGFKEYSVFSVADETLEDILKKQLGINNQSYINQIVKVAHGNMRLAILAGETVKQEGLQGIANIHDLVEMCYEKKLEEFSEEEKKTIAIASILGAHKTVNNDNLSKLESMASISHSQYKAACKFLYHKELLDMVHNYAAINFEEQNLRDYFIRYAIVEEQLFDLKDVYCLAGGLELVIKILNIILNVFYSSETRSGLIKQVQEIWDASSDINRIELVKKIGNLIPAESLAFLGRTIQSREKDTERADYLSIGIERIKHYGFKSPILECIAGLLDNTEYWRQAISLLFDCLEKENRFVEDYCYIFDSLLQPNQSFMRSTIVRERYVLEKLSSLYRSTEDTTYAVLMLRYAKIILSDEIEGTRLGEGKQVIFYRGTRYYSDELITVRKKCINELFNLRKITDFTTMADSVVFDYRGLSTEGDVSLAEETCRLILENYHLPKTCNSFFCLQEIWEFRRCNKDVLSEFSWIDVLFGRDRANKLFSLSKELTLRFADSDEKLKNEIERTVSAATEQDWKRYFSLLRDDQSGKMRKDYSVSRMLVWAVNYYEKYNTQLQELLVNTLLSLGIGCSYDCISIFSSLKLLYPSSDVRQILISRVPQEEIAIWLSNYDSYVLKNTNDYSVFTSNAFSGLEEHGEVVHFEDVVHADMVFPGFLGKYCSALMKSPLVQPERLGYYLARIDEELLRLLKQSLSYNSNLKEIEDFICFQLRKCSNCWHGKELFICVVEKDPNFIEGFLIAWIEMESRMNSLYDGNIGELYWESPNAISSLSLLAKVQKAVPSDFSTEYEFKKCVKLIVKEGIKKGYRKQLLGWLSSETIKQSPFSEIAVDVGTSLSYEERADFSIALCEKGAPIEVFMRAATAMPFDGASWSGSAIPLINKKIDYVDNLARRLLDNEFSEHALKMQEYSRGLKKHKEDVEVQEFVEPF